jgi:hypothetical protein
MNPFFAFRSLTPYIKHAFYDDDDDDDDDDDCIIIIIVTIYNIMTYCILISLMLNWISTIPVVLERALRTSCTIGL